MSVKERWKILKRREIEVTENQEGLKEVRSEKERLKESYEVLERKYEEDKMNMDKEMKKDLG